MVAAAAAGDIPKMKRLLSYGADVNIGARMGPPITQAAEAGKADDARRWAEQAETLAYGPRKARVQGLLAQIHAKRGDRVAERAARAAVVATLEALPADARNPDAIAKAKSELAALGS